MEQPMTPEEQRWRASAYDPEKIKRRMKLQYILLGAWSLLTAVWIILLCTDTDSFGWMNAIVLFSGYLNIIFGITNHKRILAGKKPWG